MDILKLERFTDLSLLYCLSDIKSNSQFFKTQNEKELGKYLFNLMHFNSPVNTNSCYNFIRELVYQYNSKNEKYVQVFTPGNGLCLLNSLCIKYYDAIPYIAEYYISNYHLLLPYQKNEEILRFLQDSFVPEQLNEIHNLFIDLLENRICKAKYEFVRILQYRFKNSEVFEKYLCLIRSDITIDLITFVNQTDIHNIGVEVESNINGDGNCLLIDSLMLGLYSNKFYLIFIEIDNKLILYRYDQRLLLLDSLEGVPAFYLLFDLKLGHFSRLIKYDYYIENFN